MNKLGPVFLFCLLAVSWVGCGIEVSKYEDIKFEQKCPGHRPFKVAYPNLGKVAGIFEIIVWPIGLFIQMPDAFYDTPRVCDRFDPK